MKSAKSSSRFARFAQGISHATGTPPTFFIAVGTVIVWALTGPIFGYSDTWQLIINTGTTIVTFLMVFLIQNTQNRDSEALQLKIDELIRAISGAHNSLLNLEELEQHDLDRIRAHYLQLAEKARTDLREDSIFSNDGADNAAISAAAATEKISRNTHSKQKPTRKGLASNRQ